MKFISESPIERYAVIEYNGLQVLVNNDDDTDQTSYKVREMCDKHGLNHNAGFKAAQVYYLRGHLHQADYDRVLIGVLESDELPAELNEIVHCLSFWNQEGIKNHEMNKTGQESYEDFILRCMAADCQAFVEPYADLFITGKGGNHVWVSDKDTNDRILLFHF